MSVIYCDIVELPLHIPIEVVTERQHRLHLVSYRLVVILRPDFLQGYQIVFSGREHTADCVDPDVPILGYQGNAPGREDNGVN